MRAVPRKPPEAQDRLVPTPQAPLPARVAGTGPAAPLMGGNAGYVGLFSADVKEFFLG
jgi:hypothetical protein